MEPDKTIGDKKPDTFAIVGIGASAGGLNSFECFLAALPHEFDFAVVFIQHLSPKHTSLMPGILRKSRPDLDIIELSDGLVTAPGSIYICPPAKEVRINKGIFHIESLPEGHLHLPIDEFLVSLAEDAADRAIAVILSGAGADGARGVQSVRTAGGTVFVQDPETAEFSGMPLAAIHTGHMDGVLPPADIAKEILKFAGSGMAPVPGNLPAPAQLEPFYRLVLEKTGYRFHHYKKSVVGRRIRRRMYLHGVTSLNDYLELVSEKESEAAALASDLMIGVTSFFRDRLAWKALHLEVTRKLVLLEDDSPIRVWTPACATGEEAYSIAMLLQHELDIAGKKREIQVFATDVNERALEKAREGIYPASISADVPQDYMRKFFTFSEDGLSVTIDKDMRQHVVFAKHDILTDPPFSRLDLVICRNLLIYLEPDAQEKCIALFHYALRNGGYLFLGNAESTGRKNHLFKSISHKKCRLYQKIEGLPPERLTLGLPFASERSAPVQNPPAAADYRQSVIQFIQESLLEEYSPAAVAIDHNFDIIYHNGPTNRFLRQPRGAPTQNLLLLLPENLRSRIRGSLYRAAHEHKPASIRTVITGDDKRRRQTSIRISELKGNLFLIIFREKNGFPEGAESMQLDNSLVEETAVRQLESELSATREELQSNIEQLKGLNEELQSSNEELQAANEELETSREELQSLNEELITVNSQFQSKIEEQEETNNDLNNFMSSTNIPTIFLDHELRVKRFTPAMTKLIKLIPADVGRPIIDMSQEFLGPDLIADAEVVLENLVSIKKEIRINGSWFVRATLPYRTADSRIEGVVVTYSDITERKKAEEEIVRAKEEWERTFDTVPDLIAILDCNHTVIRVNKAMADRLGLPPEKCIGVKCYDAVHGAAESPSFCPHALTCLDSCEHVAEVHEPRLGGDFIVSTTPIFDENGKLIGAVHVARDITERKRIEDELKKSEELYRSLFANMLNGFAYCRMIFDRDRPLDFVYLAINDAFTTLTGLKDVVGKKVTEVIPGIREADPDLLELYGRVASSGKPERAEIYVEVLKMWFSISVYSPQKEHFVAVFDVITERKRAEEVQGRLAAIVESADDAIIGKDLNGIIQTWNVGAENIFGYKADEVIGKPVSLLIPPGHVDEVPEILARIKQGEHIENFETVRMRKDGTVIPVSLTFSAIKDRSGRIIGASKIAHDITEQKRAEEALRRSNEELNRFNRAAVGRELRMIELKKEVNELLSKTGEPPRYRADFGEGQP